MQTHYEILNVVPSASLEELNAAYRQVARRAHPDLGGSADDIALVNSVMAVLRDPIQRRRYDQGLDFLLTKCKDCSGRGRSVVWKGHSVLETCQTCKGRGYVD